MASAGGAIDNWGEFKGRDYDEFTVTQDEYGFVMMEVSGDRKNPQFTLKRISRGNTIKGRDNELTDSITVFKKSVKPMTPNGMKITVPQNITGVILKAAPFKSEVNKAFHAASQWQISETQDFSKPIYDSWKQHENWYYLENRQKNDDLTDEKVTRRLKKNTTYYWRVRYRDQHLNWSDWSTINQFKTK